MEFDWTDEMGDRIRAIPYRREGMTRIAMIAREGHKVVMVLGEDERRGLAAVLLEGLDS